MGGGVWLLGDICGISWIFAGFAFYLRVSGYICDFSSIFASFGFYLRLQPYRAFNLLFATSHLTAAQPKTKRALKPGLPPTLRGY
ncbi:hypothetical protein V4V35_12185 [Bacillus infantis]|uniref:hypothetical protein n=1 Tax=Bacillus infantis TaxID=324767 RepID=UPI002FBEF963